MREEFIIYYRNKIIGGIYDNRLLVKPVKSAIAYMTTAFYELPYVGAKEMLLIDEVDNKEFLMGLFDVMYNELPVSKTKKEIGKVEFIYEVLFMFYKVLPKEIYINVSSGYFENVIEFNFYKYTSRKLFKNVLNMI